MPRRALPGLENTRRRVRGVETRFGGQALRLLGDDVRGHRSERRHAVGRSAPLCERRIPDRQRQGPVDSHDVGTVSRADQSPVSVRPEHGTHRRALAHADENRARADSRASLAAPVARDESSGRPRARASPHRACRRRVAEGRDSQPRSSADGNRRGGPGLRAVSLGGGQRQPGDAERLRSDFQRTQLQTVRGARGAVAMNHGTKRLVVVGNGMAGIACVEQILKHSPRFEITVFGDETHVNYNRILLSSVLAGERTADEITLNPLEWYLRNDIQLRLGVRVVDVNPEEKFVTGDDGSVTPYDTLLLATGSSAFKPPIQGLDKQNVFAFRTLVDTRDLLERASPGVKAIVIGGGLLGLEAARGLQVRGCDVTVVHLMATLMERQLDPDAGNYLTGKMEELGVRVMLRRATTAIVGDERAEGIAFDDGSVLEGDLVVVAAGIRPNVELGYKAGLHVN